MSRKQRDGKHFTNAKWKKVNQESKELMEAFLDSKRQLSDKSLIQYRNALQIFLIWVMENLNNKKFTDLKNRDVLRYQGWLIDEGLSASGIKSKRSPISGMCKFIMTFYDDEYPNFRNIMDGVDPPPNERVHKKEPLTIEEMDKLRKELKKQERWQELAYLEISYSTAARREEVKQLKKEIADYEPNENGYYMTHEVRTKGGGKKGNIKRLAFSEKARQAVEDWLKIRGSDECEYIFVSKRLGEVNQVNETTFNYWCSAIFSEIVGRRVYPHLFRSTRATHLVVEQGKDINSAKNLLGHESSETTEIYIVRDEEESLNDCF